MEFLNLAKDIQPSYYNAVGTSLGFSYAQLENILIQKSNSHTNAFFDLFMKWNVMQQPPHSNKRQLLADKLREIDLGGLSDRLLNEPNSTGKQILIIAVLLCQQKIRKPCIKKSVFTIDKAMCSIHVHLPQFTEVSNFIRPHVCFYNLLI